MLKIHSIIGLVIMLLTISCNDSKITFGQNAEKWDVFGNANWNFSNDELTGDVTDGDGFITTQQRFKDFTLEVEFKPDSTINSGVFIRCQKAEAISPMDCYELNIWDLHPDQGSRTGTIVTKMKPLAHVETINKWNTYKIEVKRAFIKVWINGKLTADAKNDELAEGYIALQAKGTGKVSFRNLTIRPIKIDK